MAWLERRGWSQARLAAATDISQSLVSKHLAEDDRKRVTPSPENLARYAPVLDVAYEDLMRMCGYLPGKAEIGEASAIEADVRARTAELLAAVKGAPEAFWETMIRATYDVATGYARNMAQLLRDTEGEPTEDITRVEPTNTVPSGSANGRSRRRQRPIKPRHPAFALAT